MNNITRFFLLALLMVGGTGLLSAQGYYDDDIYFNPTKDKDKNIEEAKKAAAREAARIAAIRASDFPAADTYQVTGTSTRSVDDYNRRGIFAYPDTVAADSASTDAFAYTRQIERFYNPEVVISSKDEKLAEYYYAEPANVNIIINPPYYSNYWGWGGWYGSPWYWDSPWYPYWGPSWSWSWSPAWSWGWGPSWAWGPSWSWGWGPAWGWTSPGWGWGWAGNVRPYNPRHPGALGHQTATSRPGTHSGYRPAAGRPSNSNYRPAGNYRPGYNNSNRPAGNGTYRPANTNSNNNSNYNTYSRPGRNSSGTSSFGSGSSRGSVGGATRSSGGGGGRGRH